MNVPKNKKKKCNVFWKLKPLSLSLFVLMSLCLFLTTIMQKKCGTPQVIHEETTKVKKRSRMNTLTHEYRLFRMKPKENIYAMQKWLIHIMNHMRTLGKVFQNENLVGKVCRWLKRSWQPKVTMIYQKTFLPWIWLLYLLNWRNTRLSWRD